MKTNGDYWTVYYFIVEYNGTDGQENYLTGPITIIR